MIVADWAALDTIKQSAAKSARTLRLSSLKCEYYGTPSMLSPSRRGLKPFVPPNPLDVRSRRLRKIVGRRKRSTGSTVFLEFC